MGQGCTLCRCSEASMIKSPPSGTPGPEPASSPSKPLVKLEMPSGKLHEGQVRAELQVKDGGFAIGGLAANQVGQVEDKYELEKEKLGEGGFGAVRKARCKDTGAWRAVKSIARSAVPEPTLLQEEIDIMRLLDHPNIVRMFSSFEDSCWVYLVMELCEGGELLDQITQAQKFSEFSASLCMRQMFLAVNYLHQNRIMHRDLKPENFLLASKESIESATVKLIDFGFAKRVALDQPCHTLCGTLIYIAPEVLDERYSCKADVWSLGVVLYLMLSGRLPWVNIRNENLLMKAVRAAKIPTQQGSWQSISAEAKDLVHHLLTKDVKVRPQAVQALQHCWLAPEAEQKAQLSSCDLQHLKAFGQMNTLKKAAADVLVTQLPESELKGLRKLFMQMDTNKDGTISLAEMKKGMEQSGVKLPKNLAQLMQHCDLDGSGVLDYTEFLAATCGRKQYHQKDVVWAAFKRFDVDGSGFIDRAELSNVLNEEVQQALHLKDKMSELDKIFAEVDKDGNNRIDFDEFFTMMRSVGNGQSEEDPQSDKGELRIKKLRRGSRA